MDRKEQILIAEKLLRKIADCGTYFSVDDRTIFWQEENIEYKFWSPIFNRLSSNGLIDEHGNGSKFLINDKGEKVLKIGLEKFLDMENNTSPSTINLHIGDSGNFQKNYGTIHGGQHQSPDFLEKSNMTNAAPSANEQTTNKAISKIVKYIVAPVLVVIIAAVILKNCFGINP